MIRKYTLGNIKLFSINQLSQRSDISKVPNNVQKELGYLLGFLIYTTTRVALQNYTHTSIKCMLSVFESCFNNCLLPLYCIIIIFCFLCLFLTCYRSTKSEKLYPSMLHRNTEPETEPYYCLPIGAVLSHWSQPTSPAPGTARTFPLSPTHSTPRHSIPKNDDGKPEIIQLIFFNVIVKFYLQFMDHL